MACFCGCKDFEKNPNGQYVGCENVVMDAKIMMTNIENLQERMKSSHKNVTLILDNLLLV